MNKNIKIANVMEEGKVAGPAVRMVNVASKLNANLRTIIFMPNYNSDDFKALCDKRGVSYIATTLTHLTRIKLLMIKYILFFPFEALNLSSLFKKESVDIVHISGGSWQYKGFIAAKLSGKKVVWHINDTSMPIFFKYIFKMLNKRCDGYIYASKASRNYYKDFINPSLPSWIIPAPVDHKHFDPSLPLESEFPKEKKIVGIVANVSPVKDLLTFLKMAKNVNLQYGAENVEYIIVGGIYKTQTSYYRDLQSYLNDNKMNNVSFLGKKVDTRPFLQSMDVYVCSSSHESSPTSVWEAMAMQKAIVSTKVGDVPVQIKDGINGYVVETGDFDELSKKVLLLLDDDAKRKSFGVQARLKSLETLDVTQCAKSHEEAYLSILS